MGKIDEVQRKWLADLGAMVGGGDSSNLRGAVAQVMSGGDGGSQTVSADSDAISLPDSAKAGGYADAPLEPIEISPTEATLKVGDTKQFNASGEFEDGSRDLTSEVSWSSSDPRVTIDAHGLARAEAVSSGKTTPVKITASYPGSRSAVATVTIQIEVVKPPAPHVPQLQFITIEATDGAGEQIPSNRTLVLGRKLPACEQGVRRIDCGPDRSGHLGSTPRIGGHRQQDPAVTTVGVGKCGQGEPGQDRQ